MTSNFHEKISHKVNLKESSHMTDQVFQNITSILKRYKIDFKLIEHAPVYTMQQAQEAIGSSPEQEVKVLFVKAYETKSKFEYCLIVCTGDKKVDFTEITQILKRKKVKMATPEEIKDTLGIEIGSLSPFGYSTQFPTVIDKNLLEQTSLFINPGAHDKTIIIDAKKMFSLMEELNKDKLFIA